MKIFNFNIIPNNNIQNFRGKNPDEISGAKFPEFGITSPFERLQQDVFVRGKEDSRNSLGYELPADVEICESLFSGFGLTPEETFPWRVSFTLSTYFDLVSDCKEYMLRYGKKAFDKIALDDISDDAKEAALGLIDSSLDAPEEILNIAKLYKTINSKRPNSLVFKGTEFLYAYTFLKSQRSEFLNFEDIVMQGAYNSLYMDEDNDLEEYVKFAKDLGFKNENAFFRKFTHFAPSFDNF